MAMPKLEYISWDDVEEMCEALTAKVQKSGFKPDVLIGVGRGGWVPARLLSDMMAIDQIMSMRVEFYTKIGKTMKVPIVTQGVSRHATLGKKILVIDDIADTGGSLGMVKEGLSNAKEVRVATLHFKPHSKIKPDYYIRETTAWLVYPWEKHETKRELGKP